MTMDLEERKSGVGGSDAPAILGISPWRTPLQVYLEKRGELEGQPENEAMRWGTALEPVIRQRYADETGRRVVVPVKMLRHPKRHYMIANLDGIAADNRVLEVKTSRSSDNWGDPGTDEVPAPYLAQVQHYLAVTGFEVADVAVLIGGSDFRIYEVPADIELQEMIIEKEARFWEMVQAGTPPEVQSYADAVALFGKRSLPSIIQATPEALDAHFRLSNIKEQIEALKAREDALKGLLCAFMGEADTLSDGGKTIATWKQAKAANRLDVDTLKNDLPEIYKKYLKQGQPSRRFLLK